MYLLDWAVCCPLCLFTEQAANIWMDGQMGRREERREWHIFIILLEKY
jgi:hypothetical protein